MMEIRREDQILKGCICLLLYLAFVCLKEVPVDILVGSCSSNYYNNLEDLVSIRFLSISV